MKDPIITNSNKARLVEVLRSIAELMIWGDQHNPAFFDYFAEKNILANFVRILSQKCDNKVKVQVIQTLSILVQNLANEVSIFYLLSNNYIKSGRGHDTNAMEQCICTRAHRRFLTSVLLSLVWPAGFLLLQRHDRAPFRLRRRGDRDVLHQLHEVLVEGHRAADVRRLEQGGRVDSSE